MEAKCCQETKGEEYFGNKYVNGEWITVAKPAKEMRQLCVKETCKNSNERKKDTYNTCISYEERKKDMCNTCISYE